MAVSGNRDWVNLFLDRPQKLAQRGMDFF